MCGGDLEVSDLDTLTMKDQQHFLMSDLGEARRHCLVLLPLSFYDVETACLGNAGRVAMRNNCNTFCQRCTLQS